MNTDAVELKDLRAFLAVARSGSFTAAAVELGYTQSAISQQVAALEHSVGRSLLTRRPVGVTAAGARLAEHAAHIMLRLEVAQSELAVRDQPIGILRLAMTPVASAGRVASALRGLRARRPQMVLTMTTTDPATAAALVAGGEADIALVDGIVAADHQLAASDTGLLASFPVAEYHLMLAAPIGHPLAGRPEIPLDSLVDAQFIESPAITTSVSNLPGFAHVDRVHRCRYDGTDLALLLSLVAAAHGVVLLPEHVCALNDRVLSILVSGTPLVHRIELLVLKNAAEHHREAIATLRQSGLMAGS